MSETKIKCVYANGDSFVFGQGIDPDGQTHFFDFSKKMRNESWTGVIANKLGVNLDDDYYNDAWPGASNDRIVRTTLVRLPDLLEKYKPEEILVLIGWTDASRTEFYYSGKEPGYFPFLSNIHPIHHDKTDMKVETKFHDLYYGFFNDIMEEQDRFLQQILVLQMFFEKVKIKFLFTNSLHNFYKENKFYFHFFERIPYLPKSALLIDSRTYLCSPNCCQFLFERNIKSLPCNHPTSIGHQTWANHVFDYLKLNNIV